MNFEISVICPTLNEEHYIINILSFFTSSKPTSKELFIIDGGSSDATCQIISEWQKKHSNIHLLKNPDKYVPFALNIGISQSKGSIIVRLDAHSEYANDYFQKIIDTFAESMADIVGGPMRPIGKNNIQKAIAIATTNPFGVGDSKFHNPRHKGFVDSVYLGAWKKEIFKEVGLFDTELIRNQDDEFHYRAKSYGKKIYLNPEIMSFYYPRDSFKKLFKQYYQYGYFKPKVHKKVRSEIKIRHLIPSFFVIYLIILTPLLYFSILFLIPLGIYIIINLLFFMFANENFLVRIYLFFVFPVIHISYGFGFLNGLIKLKTRSNKTTIVSSETI